MQPQPNDPGAFDLFFSFRSPYSYLAAVQLSRMARDWPLAPNLRVVWPIALRIPGFFKEVNPLWPPYLARDTWRISQYLDIPYRWPRPDPIVMDITTGEVAVEQPYIHRVSRLGVLAAEQSKGFEFAVEAGRAIWSGEIDNWHEPGHLEAAAERAGLDPAALEAAAIAQSDRLDAAIAKNESDQKHAGHWGVPLCVVDGEPFFGQDRLDLLLWRLKQKGLSARAEPPRAIAT